MICPNQLLVCDAYIRSGSVGGGTRFRFAERDAFNAYLAAQYVPVYTYEFPPHVWMYRLMRRRAP